MTIFEYLRKSQAVSSGVGNSGVGGSLGAVAQADPAYTVGEIGFGPCWQDDEPSLRQMYERACQSIVRLECEAEELRAEVALLREEQAILRGKL